jgi:hypothetical protein
MTAQDQTSDDLLPPHLKKFEPRTAWDARSLGQSALTPSYIPFMGLRGFGNSFCDILYMPSPQLTVVTAVLESYSLSN